MFWVNKFGGGLNPTELSKKLWLEYPMFLDWIAVTMFPTAVFEFDKCDVKNEEIFKKLRET